MRVIFFGSRSSKFSDELFSALADTNCEIVAAVNSPEGRLQSTSGKETASGYADMAEKMGIPVFQPDDPNTPEFIEILSAISCDAIIAGGYAVLLREELLALPKKGIAINFHASLLPEYKGKHPVFWAVRNGEKQSGITIHHLNLKLDEGNIAFQEAVDIGPNDSASDVYDKVIDKSRLLMPKLVDAINENNVPVIPQKGEGSYFSSIREEDYVLDFSLPANRNKWAVQATPGKCYFNTSRGRIFAFDARIKEMSENNETGMKDGLIIGMDENDVTVWSSDAALCFSRVALDGEPTNAGCLLRSFGYKVFDVL